MTPRLFWFIIGLFVLRLGVYAAADGFHATFAEDYCQWDCDWYLSIIAHGYQLTPNLQRETLGSANWAFFPLYPFLVRAAWLLLPVSMFAAGIIVANFFLLLFVLLAVLYIPLRRPECNPFALAAFLFAFPLGLYFSMTYSESLFAFLSVLAMYNLRRDRVTGTAVIAGLLSATRSPGIMFTPVVAVRALTPAFIAFKAGDYRLARLRMMDALLPIAIAPIGLFLFMAYLYAHVGDGLAFAHVQVAWQRTMASPFSTLFDNLHDHDWGVAFSKVVQSNAVCEYSAVAGCIVCARLCFLRFWPECCVLAGAILLAASAGLTSLQRYVLVNPIFLIFVFDWFWSVKPFRFGLAPLLLASVALQLFFVHRWLDGYFFLI